MNRLTCMAAAFAALVTVAAAQELRSDQPVTMKPGQLTADYRAVKIKVAGSGGIMDMMGGPMMMIFGMMGAMGGGDDGPPMGLMTAMEVSWTKGETMSLFGQQFLITYKVDFDMAQMEKLSPEKDGDPNQIDLNLTLIRPDAIQSMTPRPDITPAKFVEMLKIKPKPKYETPPGGKPDGS